jgi:uncharacterized protein (TIGR02271 family)
MNTDQLQHLRGTQVVDPSGDKIGKIEEIYLDDETRQPEWLLVNTGLFGTKSTFVPLQGATPQEDVVRVQFDKATVKDAPNIDVDTHLSREEEDELYRYYGLQPQTSQTTGEFTDARTDRDATDDDASRLESDSAMTRSEEQLRVGTTQEETGTARLRKYVVTDHVQQTVPVQREEVRVEREPITDANAGDAIDGPEISEAEHEVTLRQEVPVVEKETIPVERVRLEKDTVTEDAEVEADVRKEQIDMDDDTSRR